MTAPTRERRMPRGSRTPRPRDDERTTLTKEELIQRIDDASSARELDHIWEHCRVLGYSGEGLMAQRVAARRETLETRGGRRG
jgi:hypothetical protein